MARIYETPMNLKYIRELFAQEDESLQRIKTSIEIEKQGIQIASEEGKLIYILLKLIKAKYVLEIGTLAGYSTLWIARALSRGGKVISIEKSKEHYELATSNLKDIPEKERIELINADAEELEKYTQGLEFDAVFIDANKQAYPKYLDLAYNILKPGGLIIADNVLLFGSVYDDHVETPHKLKSAMQEFNQKISNTERFESIIIPTSEGLSVSVKK